MKQGDKRVNNKGIKGKAGRKPRAEPAKRLNLELPATIYDMLPEKNKVGFIIEAIKEKKTKIIGE